MTSFQAFLEAHPLYAEVYRALDRKVAMAAVAVHSVQGERLGPVADRVLGYAQTRFGAGIGRRYSERVRRLGELQRRFDRDPRVENLGDHGAAVSREDYHIALLLSIVFTNHRFEIMQRLDEFFGSLPAAGRLAAIGSGTGYEMARAAELLPGWEIESVDIDPAAEAEGRQMMKYFGVTSSFARELAAGPYDAIVACEILEHLPDPAGALREWREKLRGRMFLTMAVNIAQEDHVYLWRNLEECRTELREFEVVDEWSVAQSAWPGAEFRRGNYIAVVK